ncbi:TetR/AcrR family transcriptional regulator [Rathayibacter oskolensis]|uniref:TetR/AcrR family transcriptional regulator n=1 Tax=Rathayibacter TaxID=33886 RepID=UPI001317A3CC|nr:MULTISPECIES: TetR/AcrR family transcriptional regulator [Rathayibacter]QHC66987.1 TetR family transcriptional regulator [Rathayibacter sp. VKM Ac-2759]WKK71614.1 TetR/AcrR family transcriptional regulator [Rathayibacter oskolensis]
MPSKGSYAKGVAKREEILQTALEVFSRQGYRRASLREISEAVGLTQAGLLHYFDSKEELFAEVLRKRDDVDRATYDLDDSGDPAIAGLVRLIRHNSEVPGLVHLYATLSAEGTDEGHAAHEFFVDRYRTTTEVLAESVRADQREGLIAADIDPEVAGRMMTALADGLQIQWLLDDGVDMGSIVETFWALLKRVR